MLKENRGIPDQVAVSESQKPAHAVVQRVLREAGIGIALLLLIAIFSASGKSTEV